MPSGCAHRVENLEKSLAISANFVDCSNFEWVKRELSANASIDGQAKQLLSVFNDDEFNTRMIEFENVLPSEPGNRDQTVNTYEQDDDSKNRMHMKLKPKSRINTEELEQHSHEGKHHTVRNKQDGGILCIPWLQFKLGAN